jgi:uncharacterized repeat protein (TIGR01451 family)
VTIDGTTQGGYAGAPLIELDGSLAGTAVNGLNITSRASTVRGLVINRFSGAGIQLTTTGDNTIEGNFIGTDATGSSDLGNGGYGVVVSDAPNNTIGGIAAGARNVISGNDLGGITLFGAGAIGNRILGNYIGTDATGVTALGNYFGILMGTDNTTIGGTEAGARNVISGNSHRGVRMVGGSGNQVLGNYIGTDATGAVGLGNGGGVELEGASNTTVGGTGDGARNLISGNGFDGVSIEASGGVATGNQVLGNYIGTDAAGTSLLGNAGYGIRVGSGAGNNTIGGTAAGAGNVISGNGSGGLAISGSGSPGIEVLGNYIGTDISGKADLGNNGDGIFVSNADTTIGGTSAEARNVVSGNARSGIEFGSLASGSQMLGNYVGTDAAGTAALGNDENGVLVVGDVSIGGTGAGTTNVIAFNGTNGILVAGGTDNALRRNSTFSNGTLGIDLGSDGITPNDPADADEGPNHRQNFPVLTFAGSNIGETVVQGTLNSTPAKTFDIEVFSSPACDPLGYGEGKAFMASALVTTNSDGDGSFEVSFPTASLAGNLITSTATDSSGNTSEFSACLALGDPKADLSLSMADSPDPVAAGTVLTYHLTVTNNGPNIATGATLADTLSSKLIYQSATPSQGSCTKVATTVTCDLGAIAGHDSATVDIMVIATTAGVTTNTANANANEADPNASNNSATATTTVTPNGICTVMGTSGDDYLKGTSGDDVICGLGGADTILPGAGNDSVFGGDGDDLVKGGPGNDVLRGEAGNDLVIGGLGGDTLEGGDGDDTLKSRDRVSGNDSVDGGAGTDRCTADAGDTVVNCP